MMGPKQVPGNIHDEEHPVYFWKEILKLSESHFYEDLVVALFEARKHFVNALDAKGLYVSRNMFLSIANYANHIKTRDKDNDIDDKDLALLKLAIDIRNDAAHSSFSYYESEYKTSIKRIKSACDSLGYSEDGTDIVKPFWKNTDRPLPYWIRGEDETNKTKEFSSIIESQKDIIRKKSNEIVSLNSRLELLSNVDNNNVKEIKTKAAEIDTLRANLKLASKELSETKTRLIDADEGIKQAALITRTPKSIRLIILLSFLSILFGAGVASVIINLYSSSAAAVQSKWPPVIVDDATDCVPPGGIHNDAIFVEAHACCKRLYDAEKDKCIAVINNLGNILANGGIR
jgi:hypothetical protein